MLSIEDDGVGTGGARDELGELGGGHGLVGMRERVELYGGLLQAGSRPDGGFASCALRAAQRRPLVPRMSIRVLLVDDQALIRAGFRMILEAEEDLEVVGECADGTQAIDSVKRFSPTWC